MHILLKVLLFLC